MMNRRTFLKSSSASMALATVPVGLVASPAAVTRTIAVIDDDALTALLFQMIGDNDQKDPNFDWNNFNLYTTKEVPA